MQIAVELMKLARLVGDGHTWVLSLDEFAELLPTLPLQCYLFEEGLFVIAAAPQYEALLGAEVLRIDEQPTETVLAALEPLISRDNDLWPRQLTPYRLRELPLLHALGLIPEVQAVQLAIRDRQGTLRSVSVATDRSWPHYKLWNTFPYPAGWRSYPETLATPLPLYLKDTGSHYWFEYLAQDRAVYLQFNRVQDAPAEPLAAFSERLRGFVDGHDIGKLIVDLRWNNGGNTMLELPLLHTLIAIRTASTGRRLFVIIGRRTFSAAQNFASLVDRHTDAIFVGEPTGSSPNFVGEEVPFKLPYSQLWANVSDYYWQSSWPFDARVWIAPQLYVPPTFAAYRENRDEALEAILSCPDL